MSEEGVYTWHWRNSMKPARFFKVDARAAGAWILVLVHFRKWTILLAILFNILFILLERRGLTFSASLRAFRSWIIGEHRPGLVWTSRRKFKDTGSI